MAFGDVGWDQQRSTCHLTAQLTVTNESRVQLGLSLWQLVGAEANPAFRVTVPHGQLPAALALLGHNVLMSLHTCIHALM